MLKVISNWIGLVLACVISTYSTLIVVKGNLLVKSSTKDAIRKPPFMTSINQMMLSYWVGSTFSHYRLEPALRTVLYYYSFIFSKELS